jgi:arylformamidase
MKLVDLSAPIEEDFIITQQDWTKDLLEIRKARTIGRDGYQVTRFTLITHTGTHLDAPCHIFTREEKDGIFYVEDWPLEQLYGETVVWDIPKGEGESYTSQDFEKANEKLEVREGDIVLVHTGWGRYDDLRLKERKNWYHVFRKHPGLNEDGAKWLVKKKIKAYGQDTVGTQSPETSWMGRSPEDEEAGVARRLEPVHATMLRNNIVLLEHLTNLDKIAGRRVICGFFPLAFRGVEAAPMRAIAFLED